jgi:hypothetical protein
MTKEELEKEAEEYSQKTCGYIRVELVQAYLAGAKAQIEKMKWHIVADGDLPKDRHNVYVVYLNGEYQQETTIASYRHKYWVFNGHKTECEVIAWCELPKWEIKEK